MSIVFPPSVGKTDWYDIYLLCMLNQITLLTKTRSLINDSGLVSTWDSQTSPMVVAGSFSLLTLNYRRRHARV